MKAKILAGVVEPHPEVNEAAGWGGGTCQGMAAWGIVHMSGHGLMSVRAWPHVCQGIAHEAPVLKQLLI